MSSALGKQTKAIPATQDGDHRKRRRNRTTQSCLNCHATKRMCDRKRPCSRCAQLGLTGNCVYEVDDPNRAQGKLDEGPRLMSRIAELEGVIRELKNKPHPRWLAEQDRASHSSPASSSDSAHSALALPPDILSWSSSTSPRYSPSSSAAFPSTPSGHSPVPLSPREDSLSSILAAYAGLTDHIYLRRGSRCGCLSEAACYNVVLELSLRLRKAADVLARSPSHSRSSDCVLNAQVHELDTFAKNLLLDVPTSSPLTSGLGHGVVSDKSIISSPNIGQQQADNTNGFPWNMEDISDHTDDFMSWIPRRT
ncbi:hypothetical protein B0H10DRAFT_2021150 [Mycena sp. CBHHK59/15]|nr:hypothetical protein B0H10DRAFT_2021150 [Mycena sp. CBHHK59/15]